MITVIFGFCAGLTATACVILVARHFGFMYRPQHNRWNRRRVALHGGIGVSAAFFATALFMGHSYFGKDEYLLLALPAVMVITGFIDDVRGLMPLPKLVTEISVATIAIFSGLIFNLSGNVLLDGIITAFWIVGIINSVNMLDNIDGATSGILVISLIGLMLLFEGANKGTLIIVESLCGVLLGFIVFNFNPAKIFLGDSGSLFLGSIASLLAINFSNTTTSLSHIDPNPQNIVLISIIFSICILDTSFVVINRKINGYPIMNGDRGHIAHRLAVVFKSDKLSVLTLYLFQIITIALAYCGIFYLFVPLFIATICALYLLTIKTNHLVWPEKYSMQSTEEPASAKILAKHSSAE